MVTPNFVLLLFLLSAISCFRTISCLVPKTGHEENIRTQCGFTRYPTLCHQTLKEIPSTNYAKVDLLAALVNITISETELPGSNFDMLSSQFISTDAQLVRMTMDYCHQLIEMSRKSLNKALEALTISPENHKVDIQTWLSAVVTYQEACKDSVKDHVTTNTFMDEIHKKMDYLSKLASNPLALANRLISTGNPNNKSLTGRRMLENEEFPSWLSPRERKLLESTEITKANAVVAKDGSGNFKTVSEAIEAATGGRFVIYVKTGTYNEKVNCDKDWITLIGDGKYSTIITASGSDSKGSSLRGTATFAITGDGFIAKDIGFQNTAGPEGHQAVALTVASDRSVFYRCSISGYQDTLYALSLRQFYRECDIYGTIDFIFGNAAAVFQSCNLVLRRPHSEGSYNVIMANGRTDPGQNTGFVIQKCSITIGTDFSPVKNSYSSYLGRPWKEYSRAVVIQSNIDAAISPRGWVEWPGSGASTYKTLYFAEHENTGPGSGTWGRVKWEGYRVIAMTEATKFTVANFIGGNSWLPSTGVTFVSGLK